MFSSSRACCEGMHQRRTASSTIAALLNKLPCTPRWHQKQHHHAIRLLAMQLASKTTTPLHWSSVRKMIHLTNTCHRTQIKKDSTDTQIVTVIMMMIMMVEAAAAVVVVIVVVMIVMVMVIVVISICYENWYDFDYGHDDEDDHGR